MDRYADLNGYIAAKQRVFNHAQALVINRDDSASQPQHTDATVISFLCLLLVSLVCVSTTLKPT